MLFATPPSHTYISILSFSIQRQAIKRLRRVTKLKFFPDFFDDRPKFRFVKNGTGLTSGKITKMAIMAVRIAPLLLSANYFCLAWLHGRQKGRIMYSALLPAVSSLSYCIGMARDDGCVFSFFGSETYNIPSS